jgi:molybdopterin converting factor small subunit
MQLQMRVKLTFLAHLQKYAGGRAELDVEVLEGTSVGGMMDRLGLPYGEVGLLLVNGKLADEELVLSEGDTVLFTPVISGG